MANSPKDFVPAYEYFLNVMYSDGSSSECELMPRANRAGFQLRRGVSELEELPGVRRLQARAPRPSVDGPEPKCGKDERARSPGGVPGTGLGDRRRRPRPRCPQGCNSIDIFIFSSQNVAQNLA